MKKIITLCALLGLVGCGKVLKEDVDVKPDTEAEQRHIEEMHEDALYTAIQSGDTTLVQSELGHLDHLNDIFKANGQTPLTYAIQLQNISIIKLLLKLNASTSKPNLFGETPLHLSIDSKNHNIANVVITKKSDLKLKNQSNETILEYAIIKNREDLAISIVLKGANTSQRTSVGVNLHILSKRQGMDKLSKLLLNIKEYNTKSENVLNLTDLVRAGEETLIKYIFSKENQKKIIKDNNGKNILHHALSYPHKRVRIKMLNYLLKVGFNPNGEQSDSIIPLISSIDISDTLAIYILINKGVVVNQYIPGKGTPLAYATKKEKLGSVQKLLDHEAQVRFQFYYSNGNYSEINACNYLPSKRQYYRNQLSNRQQSLFDIAQMLNCH